MNPQPPAIPFIDLATQRERVRARVEEGWRKVLDHGVYIMGPEVRDLEARLAVFCGVGEVITCSSGTDALWLPMLALGMGLGDAVFLPSWTFSATAEAVCLTGASPVFVDVDPVGFNMDPASLEAALDAVRRVGWLKPRAVIPVDLFGMVAGYEAINAIARDNGLTVVADAAQSFGASLGNRRVGSLADVTATSFFPAKPLGCWGDGGAVFTDDPELAEVIRSVRVHGRGRDKYDNVRVGTNARLDTLQAVVLLAKLDIFEEELRLRTAAAERYSERLEGLVATPRVPPKSAAAWAYYTVRCERRDRLKEGLAALGIPTQIYYPRPLHLQPPYAGYPTDPRGLPATEKLAGEVLSLPMHPYLDASTQERICAAVRDVLG